MVVTVAGEFETGVDGAGGAVDGAAAVGAFGTVAGCA